MAASVKPLTLSLKVTVTVAVSPAARWVLSNVALMGTGALVSISKLLLVGLTVAALPAASRMGLRVRRLMVLVAASVSGLAVEVMGEVRPSAERFSFPIRLGP